MIRKPLLFALLSATLAGGAHANLLSNPGFETGDFTGWSTSGNALVENCASAFFGCAPSGGARYGIFNDATFGVGNANATQTVTLAGPGTYAFGAYVTFGTTDTSGNFEQGQITLGVQLPGGTTETIGRDPAALGAGAFTIAGGLGSRWTDWFLLSGTLTYSGVGPVNALINVNVQDFNPNKVLALAFDNVYIDQVPVPEPGTLGLLGVGMAVVGFARRRRPD